MAAIDLYYGQNVARQEKQNFSIYYSAQQLRDKLSHLIMSRTTMEEYWRQILILTKPSLNQYSKFFTQALNPMSQLQRQTLTQLNQLYDNRGATNSLTLTSYLHSSLTNPHDEWVNIKDGLMDAGFEESIPIQELRFGLKRALQFITDQMHAEWSGENFHQEIFPYYKSLVDIGTSCFSPAKIIKGAKPRLTFRCRSMFQTYFLEDHYGRPNHVWAVYMADARQVVNFFCKGERDLNRIKQIVGDRVYNAFTKWTDEVFTYVHCVYPDYGSSQQQKFISCYFLYESRDKNKWVWDTTKTKRRGEMSEDGFLRGPELAEFNPYIISRIRKEPDTLYGTGFGCEALPHLIQLQDIQRSLTIGAHKNVEPPMNIPSTRLKNQFSTRPNARNPMDTLGNRPVGVEPTIPPIPLQDACLLYTSPSPRD